MHQQGGNVLKNDGTSVVRVLVQVVGMVSGRLQLVTLTIRHFNQPGSILQAAKESFSAPEVHLSVA
jgi:hypothetical protein